MLLVFLKYKIRHFLWKSPSCITMLSRDRVVIVATRYGPDGRGIEPGGDEIFHTHPDRPEGLPYLQYYGVPFFLTGS